MITAPTQFSGLQVWLDGSDTTSLFQLSGGTTAVAANLDPVGYWGDKSGNNRHFTNIGGSATTRPTWVSSLSTVRFDGSNDYLTLSATQTYTSQTTFVVTSPRAFAASRRIYSQAAVFLNKSDVTAANGYVPLILGLAAPNINCNVNNTTLGTVNYRSLSTFDTFTSLNSAGTSFACFINGQPSSFSTSNLGTQTFNFHRIGSGIANNGTSDGSAYSGDISEVIVYNRALTDLERADVEYYLTRKWNFLNSIPRQVYGIKNGLWSLTDTWSVSAEPSPWNFPLSADNAYTNTFTITADSSTKVDTIRNSTLAPNILSGGSFVLANGVSLSANVVAGEITPFTLTLLPAASSTLVGNLSGKNTAFVSGMSPVALSSVGSQSITIYGNAVAGSAQSASSWINSSFAPVYLYGNVIAGFNGNWEGKGNVIHSNGVLNIVGNVFGGAGGVSSVPGVTISSGTLNLTGNSEGKTFNAIIASGGTVNIFGNVLASNTSTGVGISLDTNGRSSVNGNIIATNLASGATSTITSTTPLSVYGNIINAPNGRQAIYAPRYQVFPTGSAQYTRQASNGYDSYVDYWTSNSTFSYPASSDVALGTTYSNSILSGSMAVPSPSSVALGALVGTTTGTASMAFDSVLSQPISNLTTPNSIGARLKNITTSQALSSIVDSLEF